MGFTTGIQPLVNYSIGGSNATKVGLFVSLLNSIGFGGQVGFLDELSPSSLSQLKSEASALQLAVGYIAPSLTPSFDATTGFSFDAMTGWSFDGV